MSSKSMRELHEEAMALEKKMSGLREGARQGEVTTDETSGAETTGTQAPSGDESGEPGTPNPS
jgi:hypothetical protein